MLCIHLSVTHTHAHTQVSTQIPEEDSNVLSDLKGHSLLQNYIQHHYDLLSAIGNLLHLCWMLLESRTKNYTVISNSK